MRLFNAPKLFLLTINCLALLIHVSVANSCEVEDDTFQWCKDKFYVSQHKPDSKTGTKPNILLMFVDDLGYGDLSIFSHPTSDTPEIEKFAQYSKVFTQHYVPSPVCSPSRASLLTGRYHVRSGIYPSVVDPDSPFGLPLNETTIAGILKGAGYRTLAVGKWHLGVGYNGEYLPTSHGFDEYFGVPYSHDMCPCPACFETGNTSCYNMCWEDMVSCPLYNNTSIIEQPVYLPNLSQRLADKAVTFMQNAVKDGVPFFLYMPFMHVHHPNFAAKKYQNSSRRGLFGDGLTEMDGSVGHLLNELEALNIRQDTLVWFASDNGPGLRQHERGGSSGLFRCGKGTTWEGGVRVPAIVSWPGVIAPERSDALISTLDVLPTIAAIVGTDTSHLVLDGVDISDVLFNTSVQSPRKFFAIYPRYPNESHGAFAVVYGALKAHFYTVGDDLSDNDNFDLVCREGYPLTHHDPPLLFDLAVDPGERWDVSDRPEYQDALETITKWRESHVANMTWLRSLTTEHELRSQPCCSNRLCEPYPLCCDCNYPKDHPNEYIVIHS